MARGGIPDARDDDAHTVTSRRRALPAARAGSPEGDEAREDDVLLLFDRLLDPQSPHDEESPHDEGGAPLLAAPARPPHRPSGRRIAGYGAVIVIGLLGIASLTAGLVAAWTPRSPDEVAAPEPTRSETPAPTAMDAEDVVDIADLADTRAVSSLPDPAWAHEVATASGIPERALRAYAGAAIAIGETHPGCGLGWNTLAAIGLVESGHGSHDGARLGDDGVVMPRIVGIALDGNGVERIPDTDVGLLDGDELWDRAVGPMQFLPQTWRVYARDGDGDGRADIDQIDDASLSAATYLCEAGGDLTVPENWIAAITAYNPSLDYNHSVADAANHYSRFG